MISVIIIDDHPLVLSGFEFILDNQSDIKLIHTFTRAEDALLFLETNSVDVVLVDINMPGMNGIEAALLVKKSQPETRVIAISNISEGSIVQRMLDAGASGYLLKNVSASELIHAIHAVNTGNKILSAEIEPIMKQTESVVPKITQRELEVLRLMVTGKTTPQIAEQMFISPLTVESHRRNLLQKFKVSNSASLIHRATELKFI
ncbi:response regulator transcription factor [Sphingobacterium sp. SGR-19]|uniref:response regulator n=1 Tax=Sphingobacterium sp. SGR-19 TaxID=2710886 RepID=UPI0013EB2DC6|nr:response regulator transcription factor [Sphingobacterium sp. SGR-19]NGM67058.1 response regulator transcription factor [Sphingobacterium sp. SGR-19]